MEQEHKTFETFINKKIEDYRMYPSTKVWMNVHANLKSNNKPTAVALIALALLTLFTLNIPTTTPKLSQSTTETAWQAVALEATTTKATEKKPTFGLSSYGTDEKSLENNRVVEINNSISTSIPKTKKDQLNAIAKERFIVNDKNNEAPALELPVPEAILAVNNFTAPISEKIKESTTDVSTPIIEEAVSNTEETIVANDTKEANENKEILLHPENKEAPISLPHNNEFEASTKEVSSKAKRSTLQVYFTPGISYRALYDKRGQSTTFVPFSAQANNGNVNGTVFHKPAAALEIGLAWVKPLSNLLEFKAGVQGNYNSYKIKASYINPQLTTIALNNNNGSNYQINSATNLSTAEGEYPTWMENTNVQLAVPIGLNFLLKNNSKTKFGIGTTVQPTINLYNKAMLLSTDLKNYTSAPYLIRNININAGLEAFVAVKGKKLTYQFGPQLRYQVMSTYAKKYPFKENLFDYGFKFAVSNPF